MSDIANETYLSMLSELKTESIDSIGYKYLAESDHRFLKDLKINIQNTLNFENLSKKESSLIALAASINERHLELVDVFINLSKEHGASSEEIADIFACTALLRMNNVFYRFRHFVNKEAYTAPAGLKMSAMGKPVVSKEFFELVSLCISALNGCETCVKSHEASVLQHGCSEARIYDSIRLTSTIKSLTTF